MTTTTEKTTFDRIGDQKTIKKGGNIRCLVVTHSIVRHIQQKANFTQRTVKLRTKRLGFWRLSSGRAAP